MIHKYRIDVKATSTGARRTVKCADCGKESEQTDADSELVREPCQHCGSSNCTIMISMAEGIQVKELLRGRKKDNAFKSKDKVRVDFITGDELNHETGQWIKKDRIIDKEKNTYLEIVTDPDTGTEIHHCEQPLPDHKGHGSAKANYKPNRQKGRK